MLNKRDRNTCGQFNPVLLFSLAVLLENRFVVLWICHILERIFFLRTTKETVPTKSANSAIPIINVGNVEGVSELGEVEVEVATGIDEAGNLMTTLCDEWW